MENGALYLAVKTPLLEDGNTVFLKIGSVSDLFDSKKREKVSLEVWNNFSFVDNSGHTNQVTDFIIHNENIYLTTTCVKEKCGAFWQLKMKEGPKLIREFPKFHPEGIAFHPEKNHFFITFDQGEEPANFITIPFQSRKE